MFKKLMIAALSLAFIPITHSLTLDQAINAEVKKGISYLNLQAEREYIKDSADDEPYKYEIGSKKIEKWDLNADGIPDALVLVTYCEITACHITTGTVVLMLFVGQKNGEYTHVASKNLGVKGYFTVLANRVIEVASSSYRATDPACCPSRKITTKYKYSDGILKTVP